jgi:hypothetical protein
MNDASMYLVATALVSLALWGAIVWGLMELVH